MMARYERDWDELARREPYFAVLTDPRFLRGDLDVEARARFFRSGDDDVEGLLLAIRERVGHEFIPRTVLDFGCGVGRLTLPLARRASHVSGCDVSPRMITIARQNSEDAGLKNVRFVTALDEIRGQQFDLISSLLVFQHVPMREGLETLSSLLGLLAPGGVAALHFTLRRPGSILRRLGRRLRASVPLVHRVILELQRDTLKLPYMQMNEYDPREIKRRIIEATASPPFVIPRIDGDVEGAIFIARLPRA